VRKFEQTGAAGRFFLYRATLVPNFWLLTLESDCRIFQEKTTEEIVREVLGESGIGSDRFAFRLQNKSLPPRPYCVQYRESDFNFVSRLLEEEGIFYFFEHSEDRHLLVFADSPVGYKPIAGKPKVLFNPGSGTVGEEEVVASLTLTRRLRPGRQTLRDFNFEKPALDLTSDEHGSEGERCELYDYPGSYLEEGQGRRLAQLRLQEQVMYREQAGGSGDCVRFMPGFTFRLHGHEMESANREWLLTEVVHTASQPQVLQERASAGGSGYSNRFTAVPSSVAVRPERVTLRPRVYGVQTAIVTGPSGEEIYTDEHGRVKVQFHWDRLGKKDEKSSCWIRVSQPWAGAGFGGLILPRIGQEVIVDFIEADPDRPIVTGRVYHGENRTPYGLPEHKTKSTLKSESSPGGGGFNELSFEDKKGAEEIYLHGQKNWRIAIENDKGQRIGHDESLSVGNNRDKSVAVDQSERIGADKTIAVGANHTETIAANMSLTVGANKTESIGGMMNLTVARIKNESVALASTENVGGAKALSIGAGYALTVGGAMNTAVGLVQAEEIGLNKKTMVGKGYEISSGDKLKISVGKATIQLDKDGTITISGTKLRIEGSEHVQITGDTDIN
jgi:type VI secretion system secreted protein VgrG